MERGIERMKMIERSNEKERERTVEAVIKKVRQREREQ